MTVTREFRLETENEVLHEMLRETLERIARGLEIEIRDPEYDEPKRNFQLFGEIGERIDGESWVWPIGDERDGLSKAAKERTRATLRKQVRIAGKKVRDAHVRNAALAEQRDAARRVARRFRDGWIVMERADGVEAWRARDVYPPRWEDITSEELDAVSKL